MNLRDIVLNYLTDNEKGLQQLITWFLNDVMNEEVAQQAGVPRHARSSSRRAHRNGYRSRSLKTRYGELILQKPQLREIPFETKVFERYSRTEKALVNAIIESYIQGVSTRNVENVISHLGVNQISASYVSKVAQELDVKVTEFMERTIDSHIPYLYVNASYFKVRDGVKYVNKALLVVVGVRTDGYREILAARVAEKAGIRKHITPHVFRHSRITHLIKKKVSESVIKLMMWGNITTEMFQTYAHLTGQDIDAEMFRVYGIESKDTTQKEKRLEPRQCKQCAVINPPVSKHCSNCGMRLTDDIIASDNMMQESVFANPDALHAYIDALVDKKLEEKRTV